MKLKWFNPLDRLFGPLSEINTTEPITVGQLLTRLAEKQPNFAPFARFSPGDKQPHGLMVWRSGQALSLSDELNSEDELEMIIMVAGG